MSCYTPLSLVKQLLNIGLDDATLDPWLSGLIEAAEQVVESYLGRSVQAATYTEYYSGTGRRELVLRQRPVNSVTSVHLDYSAYYGENPQGAFGSDTLLTEGVDYAMAWDGSVAGNAVSLCGVLLRLKTVWPEVQRTYTQGKLTNDIGPNFGCVKVVYNAGYVNVPIDIQYAVAWVVSYMRRTLPLAGPIMKETIGDYSYTLGVIPVGNRFGTYHPDLATARQLLSRYREVAIGIGP